MSASLHNPGTPSADSLEAFLELFLREVELPARRSGPGRPALLPAMLLWSGMLVCLLRGFSSQLQLWRLLSSHGLWDWPRVRITDMALYKRLERTPPEALRSFFEQITAVLATRYAAVSDVPLASWATGVFALDHTVLDPVVRKLKLLRDVPRGSPQLFPGALACLFDVRRQQWQKVEFLENAHEHGLRRAREMVADLLPGSLLLMDLGFFGFDWFDHLTEQGLFFIVRLRAKTSYVTHQVLCHVRKGDMLLCESLVYLGAFGSARGQHPLRLIEITWGERTYRYLTNVLDPRQLTAWEVSELYRRRWDIEGAFNLLKTQLGLQLLWSGHQNVLLHQVYATLIIAQIVLAFRTEIALRADAQLREVSLPLLLQHLPLFAAAGKDPLTEFVREGRWAGFIRPYRGKDYAVLQVPWSYYQFPEKFPTKGHPDQARKRKTHSSST